MFKWLGVERALFIHPLVALTGYLLMLRAPSLQLIGALKVADNSLDYSLGNTTRQALWLPTSREAKYKAKQAIDSLLGARRRRGAGRPGVRRRTAGVVGAGVCRDQRGAGRRVARGRRAADGREPRAAAAAPPIAGRCRRPRCRFRIVRAAPAQEECVDE